MTLVHERDLKGTQMHTGAYCAYKHVFKPRHCYQVTDYDIFKSFNHFPEKVRFGRQYFYMAIKLVGSTYESI